MQVLCFKRKAAHHQWPRAELWWWRCQRCWEPGSCSIPCLNVRHQWSSGLRSAIQKIGWRVEEVGRRRGGSENTLHAERILLPAIWLERVNWTCICLKVSANNYKIVLSKALTEYTGMFSAALKWKTFYPRLFCLPDCLPAARKWLAAGFQWPRTGRWRFCRRQPPGSLVSPQMPGALEDSHEGG